MTRIFFAVNGNPVAKARARIGIRAGRPIMFADSATENFEHLVALSARKALNWREPLIGPLSVTIGVYIAPPKEFSKKSATGRTCSKGVIHPACKPDLDNFIKAALDGMNKIVFEDDAQIVEILSRKHYDARPRMEIIVEVL